MRFSPATWEAQVGEPIRIILINKGKVDHELVIGTEKEIVAHAKEMANPGTKGHHHSNEVSAVLLLLHLNSQTASFAGGFFICIQTHPFPV